LLLLAWATKEAASIYQLLKGSLIWLVGFNPGKHIHQLISIGIIMLAPSNETTNWVNVQLYPPVSLGKLHVYD
jgi:hypothetical protein